MPLVENNTDDEVVYQVNDDPPFDRCEERQAIAAKDTFLFAKCKGGSQTHSIVEPTGKLREFVKGLPPEARVAIKSIGQELIVELILPPQS